MKERNKNEKLPILKRFKKALKIAVVSVLTLGTLFFGGLAIKEGLDSARYTNSQFIAEAMYDFGGDDSYIHVDKFGNYRRLANNGDEPVYVSFDEGYEENPEYKEYAIKSLDYIFGLVGDINPDYKYEIVSPSQRQAKDLIGKSTIEYISFDFDSNGFKIANGVEWRESNIYDSIYWDYAATKNLVAVDFAHFKDENSTTIQYTYNHELLHAFGFKDVYENIVENGNHTIDGKIRFKGDTYMQNSVGIKNRMITPKDYATLCAMYMPKSSADDPEVIAEIKQKITDYTNYYYGMIDNRCYNDLLQYGAEYLHSLSRPDDIIEFEFHNEKYFHDEQTDISVVIINYIYKVKIENDNYTLELYDGNGVLLDTCEGKTRKTDHFILLEDCNLKYGMKPMDEVCFDGGYINNLCVYQIKDNVGVYVDHEEINYFADSFLKIEQENQ